MSAATAASALQRRDLASARVAVDRLAANDPAAPPLRLRLAVALIEAECLVEAIDRLQSLVASVPGSAMAWQALGAALRAVGRSAEAGAAFGRVLALQPGHPQALLAQAHVLADLHRPSLSAWQAAIAAAPDSTPARLGLATALAEAEGYDAPAALLRNWLAQEPHWREGWRTLLTLTYRWLGTDAFVRVAREAFDAGPHDGALMLETLRALSQADRHDLVLTWSSEAERRIGSPPPLRLAVAESLDSLGRTEAAARALNELAPLNEPTVDLALVRHHLRQGDALTAAAVAIRHVGGAAGAVWVPYLGTAWRLAGDPRHAWLEGDPRLIGSYDLGLSGEQLDDIANHLRTLHTGRFPPFQQSIRGGTQTEGHLLTSAAPAIRLLRTAIERAVAEHVAQLPPPDATHPTLCHARGATRFVGSWSVRLRHGGRHVNHVHSEGWLSSACYLALPPPVGEEGWLTLGEPPQELRTRLGPVRSVRPERGRVVLFPSSMWHGTTPFGIGERLSVAFDVKSLT